MSESGYLSFAPGALRRMHLGDVEIAGQVARWPFQGRASVLEAVGQATRIQAPTTEAGEELLFARLDARLDLFVQTEEAFRAVHLAMALSQLGTASWFFPAIPSVAAFSLTADPGRTTYRLPRRLPWNVSGWSHAQYPVRAWSAVASTGVMTELTVVTAAPASATEVQVPTSVTSSPESTITVHTAIAGDVLLVLYHPELRATITGLPTRVPSWNEMRMTVDLREIL